MLCVFSQDDANKNGGKWIIRLRKGLASRCWENLILAMLGEQFMVGEEICGAVVSVRFQVSLPGGRSGVTRCLHSPHCPRLAVMTPCPSCRRTLFPYGIRLPATKPPPPESGIRFGECLTYLPTPLWNTKPTPTASSTCWGGSGGHLPKLGRGRSLVGARGIWSYRKLTYGEGTDQPFPPVLLSTGSSSRLARLPARLRCGREHPPQDPGHSAWARFVYTSLTAILK